MSDTFCVHRVYESLSAALGESTAKALIEELRLLGVSMNNPNLSLESLAYGINMILGQQAGSLVIDKILIKIEQLTIAPIAQ